MKPSLRLRTHLPRARARTRALSTTTTSTVNPSELAHFSRLSHHWWDERGEFALLHRMNPVRMRFIRDKILEIALEDEDWDRDRDEREMDGNRDEGGRPLDGMTALDVGCGGGLLSEVNSPPPSPQTKNNKLKKKTP